MADDNVALGTETASSAAIDSEEAAATMLQAGVDRYEVSDNDGAKARFEAVHASGAASAEQKVMPPTTWRRWRGMRATTTSPACSSARRADNADSATADLACQMLQSHWGEIALRHLRDSGSFGAELWPCEAAEAVGKRLW